MPYYVYILASKPNGTLYIGMTNDLVKRVYQHKNDVIDGFTKKYQVHRLVYYEVGEDALHAIAREKQLKRWKRHANWSCSRRPIPTGKTCIPGWLAKLDFRFSTTADRNDTIWYPTPPVACGGLS